jgi:hypothetical protein
MNNADDLAKEDTALDLLEEEDQRLQELFALLDQNRGTEVEERSVYGDTAKQIIRHIANREAALHDVVEGMSELTGLNDIVDRMDLNTEDRRQLISQAEGMSRGVQGINLNTGQDFHSVVAELANLLISEIEWELSHAIPTIRDTTNSALRTEILPSASHTKKHAPTNLGTNGPRWYERAPVLSRLITMYDHRRDFPKASKDARD